MKRQAESRTVHLVRDARGRLRKPQGVVERLLAAPVELRRDCATGRFVSRRRRADGCDPKRPGYPRKSDAVRAFVDANLHVTEPWGLESKASGGEFDSINERYALTGRRKVRTLRQAIEAAAPSGGGPYYLDEFDLAALDDTAPGREHGPFRLPDAVHEFEAFEAQQRRRDDGLPF